ncbi:uncharacterized protein [Ptychodera flava]|uniref:uncharacterized protein n=1 Tax=Ptychodera flava TaxID=63121 RepID=UPI00396A80BA
MVQANYPVSSLDTELFKTMIRIVLLSTVLGFVTSLTIDVRDQQSSQLGDASTILHCSYSGVPAGALALTLEWKKILDDGSSSSLASKAMPNGRPTLLNNRYAIVDTGSLRIANVTEDDDGDYTCNVRYYQSKLVKESLDLWYFQRKRRECRPNSRLFIRRQRER